ncbi:MAG: cytochrome c maturation protein CcmE [Proteobacteria bacterium]|jgi:cytochrome c-type biogenesis protein CcmE|nr:cytochrome c maturation protein CcmE [Pseudomonadota bacterium]NCX10999.1 cytochrome c maturation protein CcmE [Pseudomonadota bacterium]NCX24778.1 cytochrome c maturation protein CcmE [Pseudomonadota bacterium]NCX29919.1 cytochrome c maturation protein CcmE [Pseudomonadota bacterium]
MKPIRKKRLMSVLLILITSALGSYLIIKALDSNLDFFYTPSELTDQEIPNNKRIKVGGMVLEGSVLREKTKIEFVITDYKGSIEVVFDGVVPDLFKEGSGVVVLGYLNEKTLYAEEVLAKHDENYMPPSIDIGN